MDKRLPLALLLSIVVLVGWNYLFGPKPSDRPQQPPSTTSSFDPSSATPSPTKQGPETASPAPVGETLQASAERTVELRIGTPGTRGSYFARFTNVGARLLDLRLGDSFDQPMLDAAAKADIAHWTHLLDSVGQNGWVSGSLGLRASGSATAFERGALDRALWTMEVLGTEQEPTGVEFAIQPGSGVLFKKRVSFIKDSYELKVELSITNQAAATSGAATFLFTPAEVVPSESGDSMYVEPQAVAAGRATGQAEAREKPELRSQPRDASGSTPGEAFALPLGPMSFGGVHNKYFAVLARADGPSIPTLRGATWRAIRDEAFAAAHPEEARDAWRFIATDILLQLEVPELGATKSWSYTVYAGPKDPVALAAAHPDYATLLEHDLGFFTSIAHFLLVVLNFFHGIFGNWGVAIILLTVSVRLVLLPLNRRSQTAMARYQTKMKRIQPQIEALKKRHEKDPAKLRQEQALIMQKEGAFPPLGGCLPMFLQIPVFFGLFSALRASYDLRQAPFAGWILDLAKPDQLVQIDFNTHLPFIGTIQYFNLLPILMVVLWVLQQRLMPKPTDEQALKMHRMMTIMPVFMGFFLYSYAAGLSLYMMTQSALGIIEQLLTKKFWPLDATELPKKTGGFFAKIAKLQEEQAKKLSQPSSTKKKRK